MSEPTHEWRVTVHESGEPKEHPLIIGATESDMRSHLARLAATQMTMDEVLNILTGAQDILPDDPDTDANGQMTFETEEIQSFIFKAEQVLG
ncbi:MAG: hypothetical protein F4X97_14015 [Boseongicola sp. SB0662_bin_57]|nr:hypothetical protein [Boseongicola sp. SB0662_bin_57]